MTTTAFKQQVTKKKDHDVEVVDDFKENEASGDVALFFALADDPVQGFFYYDYCSFFLFDWPGMVPTQRFDFCAKTLVRRRAPPEDGDQAGRFGIVLQILFS